MVAFVVLFAVITNVNTALVRADVIYKQGAAVRQPAQLAEQRGTLPPRALAARTAEDRTACSSWAALCWNKPNKPRRTASGAAADPVLDDVLALTPDRSQRHVRTKISPRAAEPCCWRPRRSTRSTPTTP
ncbi:MAG: hypothetical protein R2854_24055 [Caldilineaceae bacterium]